MNSLRVSLFERNTIALAAERLAARSTPTLGPVGSELRPLLAGAEKKVQKRLLRALEDGSYEPERCQITQQMFDKLRDIFVFTPIDFLAHTAFAIALSDLMEGMLSEHTYAYRVQRSNRTALEAFAEYVRAYRKRVNDPKLRGLYVLRCDVKSYADSIPMHEGSKLWPELAAVTKLDMQSDLFRILKLICRASVRTVEGTDATMLRGVPLGSPIGCALMNLYLNELDVALGGTEGAFYARYCDDFIFVHENPHAVVGAIERSDRILAERLLRLNPKKRKLYYFNGAARPSAEWPEAEPTAVVPFVGADLRFDGTFLLTKKKGRELLVELSKRFRDSSGALDVCTGDDRARAAITIANAALDSRHPMRLPHSIYLRDLVNDRGYLKDLDFQIARLVARVASGERNWRSLRRYPPRKLRDLGLLSLVRRRNAD